MKPTASKKLEQQIQTGPLAELETLKNKYNFNFKDGNQFQNSVRNLQYDHFL